MLALSTWLTSPLLPSLVLVIGAVLIWLAHQFLPPHWPAVRQILRALPAVMVLLTLVAIWSLRRPVSPSRFIFIFPPTLGLDLSLTVQLDEWGRLFGLSLLWPVLVMAGLGLLSVLDGRNAIGAPAWSQWLLLLAAAHVVLVAADWLMLAAALLLFDLVNLATAGSQNERGWGFLVNGLGGLAVIAASCLLSSGGYSLTFSAGESLLSPVATLIAAVALVRTAPYPLHFWLPHSTAVSLPAWRWPIRLSSSVLGLYLLVRITPLLVGTILVTRLIQIVGIVGCLVTAFLAWLGAQREPVRAVPFVGLYQISLALLTWSVSGESLVGLWMCHLLVTGMMALAMHRTWVDSGASNIFPWWGAVPGGLATAALVGLPLTVGLFVRQPLFRVLFGERRIGWLALLLIAESVLTVALLRVWDGLTPGTFSRQGTVERSSWHTWVGMALLVFPLLLLGLFPSLIASLAGLPAVENRFLTVLNSGQLAQGGIGLWAALVLPVVMGYGLYRSGVSWPGELDDERAQLAAILSLGWLHRAMARLLGQVRQALWSVGAIVHGEGYLAWVVFTLLLLSLLVLRLE